MILFNRKANKLDKEEFANAHKDDLVIVASKDDMLFVAHNGKQIYGKIGEKGKNGKQYIIADLLRTSSFQSGIDRFQMSLMGVIFNTKSVIKTKYRTLFLAMYDTIKLIIKDDKKNGTKENTK